MFAYTRLAGEVDDSLINVPDDPVSAIVWGSIIVVLIALGLLIRRTRIRLERQHGVDRRSPEHRRSTGRHRRPGDGPR
jgi:hypothetical protein